MPDWKKLIAAKIAIAKKGNQRSTMGANERIPPGQKQVTTFPVLDLAYSLILLKKAGNFGYSA